jgi:hypothetical protein
MELIVLLWLSNSFLTLSLSPFCVCFHWPVNYSRKWLKKLLIRPIIKCCKISCGACWNKKHTVTLIFWWVSFYFDIHPPTPSVLKKFIFKRYDASGHKNFLFMMQTHKSKTIFSCAFYFTPHNCECIWEYDDFCSHRFYFFSPLLSTSNVQ